MRNHDSRWGFFSPWVGLGRRGLAQDFNGPHFFQMPPWDGQGKTPTGLVPPWDWAGIPVGTVSPKQALREKF